MKPLLLAALLCVPAAWSAEFNLPPGQAVDYLLEHSRSYQKNLADREDARQDVRSSRGSALPSLDAELVYTRLGNVSEFELPGEENEDPLVLQTAAEDNYTGSLSLTQPVFNGAVFYAIGVARSYNRLAEYRLHASRNDLVRDFLQQYAQVLMLEELVDLNSQVVSQTKAHYDEALLLHEIGSLSRYDLLRSEVEYLNSIPALRDAEKSLELAENALRMQLDLEADTELALQPFFLELDLPGTVEASVKHARERRPELHVAQSAVEGYERGVKVYRSDQWPTLTAFANAQRANVWDMFSGTDDWENTWNAGLSLNIPVFSGFRRDAQVQKGRMSLRRAKADLGMVSDQVQMETRAAWAELDRSRSDLEAWRHNVEAAEEGLAIARLRNENGDGSGLELRDALTARKLAGVNLAQAEYRLRTAQIEMAHALGVMDTVEYRTQLEGNEE